MALEPKKIAVLMGGSSFEREFSLKSGRYVTRTLEAAGHTVLPLDTTSTLVETLRAQKPDVAYSALHGKHGEDGTIQSLLEFLGIPFVGSPSGVCRQTWNKSVLPYVVSAYRAGNNQQTTEDQTLPQACWPSRVVLAAATIKDMGAATALDLVPARIEGAYPVAVKPARGGSAMGVSKVSSVKDLASALLDALSYDTDAIIEKWVDGVEIAVCVVGTADDAYTLPPVEIVPKQGFFDIDHRIHADLVDYYAPVRLGSLSTDPQKARTALASIEYAALEAHKACFCRDLSRVDMIWDGEKPVVLEVNVSPGMTEQSLFPIASEAADKPFVQLLEELLAFALSR